MFNRIWHLSDEDPRAWNRHARRVRAGAEELLESVCSQHRYEVGCLPLAVQYKWPTKIDYSSFVKRLRQPSVMDRLVQLYKTPWDSILMSTPFPSDRKPNTRNKGNGKSRFYASLEKQFDKNKSFLSSAG